MTKYCKCMMLMKFLYKDDKVFQYFIVTESKYRKYILQNRFSINQKLEDFIERNALSLVDSNYTFLNRKVEDDRITLEFACSGDVVKRPTGYFSIVGDIPCSEGCEECKYRSGNFCTKKEKEIEKMLKSCKMFSQSNGELNED